MLNQSLTHPFDPIFITDLDLIYQNALHRQAKLLEFLNKHPDLLKENPTLKTKIINLPQSLNQYYEPFIHIETSQMPFKRYQIYHVKALNFSSKAPFLLSVKKEMIRNYHKLGKDIENTYKSQWHHEFLDPALIFKRQEFDREEEEETCYYKEYHALIKPLTKSLSDTECIIEHPLTKKLINY